MNSMRDLIDIVCRNVNDSPFPTDFHSELLTLLCSIWKDVEIWGTVHKKQMSECGWHLLHSMGTRH